MNTLLVQHQFPLRATCPMDDTEDVYNVIVSTDRTIPVETVLGKANGIASRGPIYQEDLTRTLAKALGTDVEVVTHGIHSGVYTTCRCSG